MMTALSELRERLLRNPVLKAEYDRLASAADALAELSPVTIRREIVVEDRANPRGTIGVVVEAYADGRGYEVEFEPSVYAVATVAAEDIDVRPVAAE